MTWLSANMGTIFVLLMLVLMTTGIIRGMIRERRAAVSSGSPCAACLSRSSCSSGNSLSSCGCRCGSCPMGDMCRRPAAGKEERRNCQTGK